MVYHDKSVSHLNATLSEVFALGHVVIVGVVEQSLRRDAAHVEASSSICCILLNTHSLQDTTQLQQ